MTLSTDQLALVAKTRKDDLEHQLFFEPRLTNMTDEQVYAEILEDRETEVRVAREDAERIAKRQAEAAKAMAKPEQAAYVIDYTDRVFGNREMSTDWSFENAMQMAKTLLIGRGSDGALIWDATSVTITRTDRLFGETA